MVEKLGVKDMPYSGIECDKKTKTCKLWFAQTVDNKTITVEIKDIEPVKIIQKWAQDHPTAVHVAENRLEDAFNNSKANLQGVD